MKIQVLRADNNVTGYGRMAAEIVAALERRGVECVDYDPADEPAPYIIFMTPPQRPEGWYEGQHTALFSMWESTELAMEHLTTVPLFDTVFVPCKQNKETFGRINKNVHVTGLGCNYDEWYFTPRQMSDPFTIITAGKGGKRKGIDIAIKVFKKFRDRQIAKGFPRPRFIIKSDAVLSKPDPDIIVINDMLMSAEDERKLYEQAHVYLGLSRGEGWGMIPHQTIAQGMPTILTNAHGHADFAHYGIGIDWKPVKAETEIVGRTGEWWEPSEEKAYEALCEVFEHYDAHLELAEKNAKAIRKEFSWDKVAEKIVTTLPAPSKKITDKWVVCPQTLLLLRVAKPIDCNIGNGNYQFRPGNEYQVTADVKRVIFDAGYIDESCLDPFEEAMWVKEKPLAIDEDA